MPIKDKDYNNARAILVANGSMTASKSHTKHAGKRGSPDGHGRSLLREAADEWGLGISLAQGAALLTAAVTMGLEWP